MVSVKTETTKIFVDVRTALPLLASRQVVLLIIHTFARQLLVFGRQVG